MKGGARIALLAGLLVLLFVPSRAAALGLQSIGPTFAQPVFVTSPPGDPRLFVVERAGRIQVVHDGTVTQFLDINALTTTDGERGLLSMAFDPNYASNGLFYVFYTGDGTDSGGALGDIHIDEFQVSSDPNVANAASRRTVWTFAHSAGNHNGGQLQFGPDGLLYISVGDNATGSNAQSLANPYGKIFRIDPHGAGQGVHGVPADNPFTGSPTPEIWGYGLRNPFRLSFDHATGDLIIGDVGETKREEVDLSPAASGGGRGANYGWPCREGLIPGPTSCSGTFVDPVFDYPHPDPDPAADDAFGCAIIGGYVYRGTQAPEIAGRYLYADLCTAELRSIQLGVPFATDDRGESASGALTSARSFGEDSACNLYAMNTTTVFRIVGSASGTAAGCTATAAVTTTQPAFPSATTPPVTTKRRKCKQPRRLLKLCKRIKHGIAAA